jgi:hypothetical protein
MNATSFIGARISTYQPEDSAPQALKALAGEPYLFMKPDSPRWAQYARKKIATSLLVFQTPDGPVLVLRYRMRELFFFVVADFGDPEVCQLLDSWKAKGFLQTRMALGNKVVTAIEPARDLHLFEKFRQEAKHRDPVAFVRSSAFLREAEIFEQYAVEVASQGPDRIVNGSLDIDVKILATEQFADATVRHLIRERPDVVTDILQSVAKDFGMVPESSDSTVDTDKSE